MVQIPEDAGGLPVSPIRADSRGMACNRAADQTPLEPVPV